MRFLFTLLVLTLSSPLISAAGNIGDPCCDNNQCSTQVTCNTGLTCCYQRPVWMESIGGTCYDPKVSTCAWCPVYNPNHPQTQVCPNSSPTCCGKGQQCINDKCVIPPTCPSGTLPCGTLCYQSKEYVCADPSKSTLCPISSPKLCGNACYSESKYTCLNGVLQPVGNPTTGPTTVPTTTPTTTPTSGPTSSTPAPGCVMPGDLKCGTRCYSPLTHACANPGTSQLCPIAFPLACGDACYSASEYSCSNGQLVPVGTTIGPTPVPGCVLPGDLKCGTRCYNPTSHVCADPGSSFLCDIAFPLACGDACYSPTQYKCVNGQLQPV